MINKKILLTFLLISTTGIYTRLQAQNDSTHLSGWYRIDQKLKERYEKVNYDTLYIGRPKELLTVRLKGNMAGSIFRTHGKHDGESMHGKLQSDYQESMGVDVGYCGLTVGITINPASISGKNKDQEYNLNYYDNRFGFDVVYQSVKSFEGYINYLGNRYIMPKGDVSMHMLRVNAYYVFNGKRFSYPAAFDHTYIQKHSAGTWLAGMSYQGGRLRRSVQDDSEQPTTRLYSGFFAIGGGYAYNWVFHRRWLVHVSALPSLIIVDRSNMRVGDRREDSETKFPDIITTERLAIVRKIGRYFAGASMVMNNTLAGDNHESVTYSHWNAQIVFGMRF